MPSLINVYCDESSHLEHDLSKVMAIGAVWCLNDKVHEISKRIREIKSKNNVPTPYEAKWNKVSSGHCKLYIDLVDYFFDDDDLHFRGVVIPDKTLLHHERHSQTHDEWYYKMFFVLLKVVLDPNSSYDIYLDYKDTNGGKRVAKLHDVLCNNYYDFSREIIRHIRLVRSHQVEILQLTDIFAGALAYLHRGLTTSNGKMQVVERIKQRSHYSLMNNTLYREDKFNLLIWKPILDDITE